MKLDDLGGGASWLKAGILGFQGSGKSYTGMLALIAMRTITGSKLPIRMFDTEGGSPYLAGMHKELTGQDLQGVKSQRLPDLVQLVHDMARDERDGFLLVDSITHVWRNVQDSYLAHINDIRQRKGYTLKTKLDFQDWGPIKSRWADWVELYLNSPLHIVICGRAGYEWDYEEVEQSDGRVKKELRKGSTKMKAETEFGYEPSLVIEMELDREARARNAVVNKDRFGAIDNASTTFVTHRNKHGLDHAADLIAVANFLQPHMALLVPGGDLRPINMKPEGKDFKHVTEGIDPGTRKFERTVLLEKLEAGMKRVWPSMKAQDKAARLAFMEEHLGTSSQTEIKAMPDERLLGAIKKLAALVEADDANKPDGVHDKDLAALLDDEEVPF